MTNLDLATPLLPLPAEIASRFVAQVNGLRMHVLEAGDPAAPCIVLLHGFPELAFSWREVMPTLAGAGFYVVAPDQRGFGRTTGADTRYDADLTAFRQINLVTDVLALVSAMGVRRVAALVGHDFGSVVAAWAALIRPDVFERVVLMSAPFGGAPGLAAVGTGAADLDSALAALTPPRRHYTHFFGLPNANADMLGAPQGLAAFLRGYFHVKSGDFAGNDPFPLGAATPQAFAALPSYYVMPREAGMAEVVAATMPPQSQINACRWMTDEDLAIYAADFARTGFQGGLNWYRAAADPALRVFSGRAIEVPAAFIAGARDWGVRQSPGSFEAMTDQACARLLVSELIPSAGHWVQQEAGGQVSCHILDFLRECGAATD